MKRLFLLITTILLAFTITACGGDDDPVDVGLTSVTISGVTDQTIMVDDVFNVFTGVVATGSDTLDYTSEITADSDNCTINADGTLVTAIQAVCIINYTVVVNSKLDTAVANITIDKETIVVDNNAPLVMGWTFDDDTALVGWTNYTNGDGSIISTVEDETLKLEITSGAQIYETRYEYMGVPLEQGVDYVVSFRAKALDAGKIIHLQFGALEASEFDAYFTDFKRGQTETAVLTTDWVDYSYSFTMTLDNVRGGPLFEMGDYEGSVDIDTTIWIDDLEIRGGSDVDEKPAVFAGVDNAIVFLGDAFDPLLGMTAVDYVDGDITSQVNLTGSIDVNTVGVYWFTYKVRDEAGNLGSKLRMVTVIEDVLAPVVTGVEDKELAIDSVFNPMTGVKAMDNRDGDVTADIVVTGTVDTAVAGEYTLTYTVEDEHMNSVSVDRVITIEATVFIPTDIVQNGTFDVPGWGIWMADWNSTNADVTFDGSVVELDIADVGAENWNIQLFQEGLSLVKDQQYIVSFDAMSTVARDINLKVIGATEYVSNISLTTTMDPYTYIFTYTDDSAMVKLDFELGGAQNGITVSVPSVVTFDNVMVEEYDGTAVVAETNMVVNADFALTGVAEWASWSRDWDPVITSSLVGVDGVAMFTYDGVGDATYQAKVEQGQYELTEGQTYRITFDAKGDAARDFFVSFYDGAQDFKSEALSLGTDWASYQFTFVWDSSATGLLQFELGLNGAATGGVFYLDNVEMVEAGILIYAPTDFLQNGTFDFPGWGTWMADWNSTDAAVTFDGSVVELDIADVGAENWNIQLFQEGLSLVKDQQYIVSFDAMSTVARDINLKVIGATEYVSNISLTTTMDPYTYIFTYTDDSAMVKLDFELGGAQNGITVSVPSVVTFDNVMVEEYDGTAVVAETNMVMNSEFDLDATYPWASWSRDWDPVITSSLEVVDGVAMFTYDGVGDATYQAKVEQGQFAFVTGATYRVSFDAKGDAAREFHVSFYDGAQDFKSEALLLGTDWAPYEFTYVWDSSATGLLQFELGLYGATTGGVFSLDNVVIELVEMKKFVPTDIVQNGTFDFPGWGIWMADWNSTDAAVTFDGSVVELDIADVGAENWNIQLFQEGLSLVKDQQYIVSFDAMSTVARDINLKVIGATEYVSNISLTTTMDPYTYIFTYTDDSAMVKLDFELGGAQNGITVSVPSVVTFDNVMVEEYDGTAAVVDSNMLVNSEFDLDATTPWASWSRDWDPVITSSLTVVDGVAMFTYDGVGDATYQAKVEQGQYAFVTGETYKVKFDAKADAERDFHVSFYDGAQDFKSEMLPLGTEWESYEFIFVWDSSATGLLQFELGLYGAATGGVFYLDNVVIEVADY